MPFSFSAFMPGLTFDGIAVLLAATLLGGLVRGFTGFGFAMVFMPLASIVLGPVAALGLIWFIDLPVALPTAVAGIALTALYSPHGWVGALFAALGIKIAFTPIGVFVARVFVGMPFIVRTVEPVLAEVDLEVEEAAATLGAGRFRAIRTVVLPVLAPALLTGFALSFARAVGEYGSVIFIAGNIPYVTEIAPLLIVIKLEEFNYAGATAVAAIMLGLSFATLLAINFIQYRTRRRFGHV